MDLNFLKGFDFFVGVPDSQLRPLCYWLMSTYGVDPKHHIVAANEGNCVAIAAGYHLATGKTPVVYMQNSGEGNVVNPVASLLDDKVYGIPCVFIIGWRGEPEVHDEPQHVFQGEITLKLLETLGIEYYVIDKDTKAESVKEQLKKWKPLLESGKQVAFVVKKGALEYDAQIKYANAYALNREEVIRRVVKISKEAPIVSTTGKASRELFEIREANGQDHRYDFLTVGSMGHSSSIALGVAINQPQKKIWCIDGDGAVLMHMGAMAVIGTVCPNNFVHIIINNEAHETVGGMPTVAGKIDLNAVARACGYKSVCSVNTYDDLENELEKAAAANVLSLIEVKCGLGARTNLGRPTTTPVDNKDSFMRHLSQE